MKKILVISLLLTLCSGLAAEEKDLKIYEGIAERSKAGLVVSGVMITSLPESDLDKYAGKLVKVKGYVSYKHAFQIDENDPVKKQGFNMPVMYKVVSIEIVEKK